MSAGKKDDLSDTVVLESGGSATLTALHPLVLLNISDHHTRQRVINKKNVRVVGALVGEQKGRRVEVFNSFALPPVSGDNELDMKFLRAKFEQFQKVFPTYDILGWYSTGGDEPTPEDLSLQAQLAEVNESPLYLLLNTAKAVPSARGLPITLYESEIKVVKNEPKSFFSRTRYFVETGESERISVDHVAHLKLGAEDESSMAHALSGVENAIKRLAERVVVIRRYLQDTIDGKTEKDHALLRQVASLCNLLPAIDSDKFKDEFLHEYNDTLLLTYLASVTKGTNLLAELVDKFNIAHERQGRRRGFFG